MSTCSTPGCVRKPRNNNCPTCQACYRRERRHADPEVAAAAREAVRRAIEKKRGTPCLPRAERFPVRTPEQNYGAYLHSVYERFPVRTPEQNYEAYLHSVYGLTLEQYKILEAAQDGVCAICDKPDASKKRKLHVDRRRTGKKCTAADVRGLLCHNCKAALGLFKDSEQNLQKAIDYLKQTPYLIK